MKKKKYALRLLKGMNVLVLISLIFFTFLNYTVSGQTVQNTKKISGKIVNSSTGEPVWNASIRAKGQRGGAIADSMGVFKLTVPSNTTTLIITSIGYDQIEVPVTSSGIVNVKLVSAIQNAGEVVVVAYGTQKKTSMVSSITSLSPKELKGPTANLTTMLAGRIAGIISYQRSGEPGADNAQFFIRGVGTFGAGKVNPLILIDGIESDPTNLARLQPDDIAGFSILKDATASALYGARGANGVILVTTKMGETGKMKFDARFENATSANTKNFALADNVTYMQLANEAVLTRNPIGAIPYGQSKIDHTAKGDNPLLYPTNNWMKQLIKDNTNNQRFNINASGGSDKAKYYIAMTYNIDNGILKDNSLNGFSNNIKLKSYSLLSNVTLNLTKTTEILVSLKGQFDDYTGPNGGGTSVFHNALWSNPVMFPAVYPAQYLPFAKHPLFGNSTIPGTTTLYNNPYAQSLSGYQTANTSTVTAQMSIKQNFDFITQGLSLRVMAYTTRYANFTVGRQYSPYYYSANVVDGVFNGLNLINSGVTGAPGVTPTEYLTYAPGVNNVNSSMYGEAAFNYSRTFNTKHAFSGLLIGTMRDYLTGNAPSLQLSLPSRNMGVSGRFTYGYDNRYLFEANFGYNGSERFAANHRYGLFPSIGAGWIISNEKFMKAFKGTINQLKLRFTYGLVGNDQIGNVDDRFFYLSDINMNGTRKGGFGTDYSYSTPTIATNRYENQAITWETSKQTNIGLDLTVFKNLTVTVDAYQQYRDNILLVRTTIPNSMGLQAAISTNGGAAYSRGVDVALEYRKTFKNGLWLQARGTMTYATNKLLRNEEPVYPASIAYLTQVGSSLNQPYGLVAERLFIDAADVANSPRQTFGVYQAGDIKYRDINGDGQIDNLDKVPIGLPNSPEVIYGAGFSFGNSSFDISCFIQGSARSSFMINVNDMTPFYLNGGSQNGLLQIIADNHWQENNRNSYAFWPRLSNTISANNNQISSWWLQDGSFIRMKSAEIGYQVPAKGLKKIGMSSIRVYLNATNLFSISSFKLWDPEMGASGLGYPVQKVYNVGVKVSF